MSERYPSEPGCPRGGHGDVGARRRVIAEGYIPTESTGPEPEMTLGRHDGTALAGRLLEGTMRPTLEGFLDESAAEVRPTVDEAAGVPVIR